MNIYVAIGHITDAPKKTVKQETGLVYVNFQMSIPTFEGKTKYEYIPCIAFGKTADRIAELWKDKSQKYGIEGYIVGHNIGVEADGKTKKKLLKVVVKKIYYAESRAAAPVVDMSYDDAKVAVDSLNVPDDELPF
jgi:single-stranded DNA-binding protein